MTTPPLISIFIPIITAEDADNLESLLNSISNQTFTGFRVHICDDTLERRAAKPSRLAVADGRFIYLPNRGRLGAVFTYRRGFFLSLTGEYIVRAKAGHLWEPEYLQQCLETLKANPQAAGAYGQARDIHTGEIFDDSLDGENPDPQSRYLSAFRSEKRSLPYGLFRSALAAPLNNYFEYGISWPSGAEADTGLFTVFFDHLLACSLALQYPLIKNGKALLTMDWRRQDRLRDQWVLKNIGMEPAGFYFPIVLLDMAVNFAKGRMQNDLIGLTIKEMAGQYRDWFGEALQLVRRFVDGGVFDGDAGNDRGAAPNWTFGRAPMQDFFLLHYLEIRLEVIRAYLPDLPDVNSALASILLRKGLEKEALAEVEKELGKNPLSSWALSLKSRLGQVDLRLVN